MGAEGIRRYRAWVESLPSWERDEPYLPFKEKFLTPNEVLRLMELGTPEGLELQAAEEKLMRRG